MIAKISFSTITLATAASAVDIESFLTRMRLTGSQSINCKRSGSRPRTFDSCMNNYPECTWVSQCQAAESYCDDRFYNDCLSTSNCVWVGQSNAGYCERDTTCGDSYHACESSCINDDLCEWAEGCQTNDYGALSDCGGAATEDDEPSEAQSVREAADSEDRRLDSSRSLCGRHSNSISCNGDYANDCTWTGDNQSVGFCHPKTTPIQQQPCGMLYSSSACGKFDHCSWAGNTCVETPVRQPCGMLYSPNACSTQSHCAWNGSSCAESAVVTQACGMLYSNEACYTQEHCRWNGSTCADGPAPAVSCMFYSPSACWDQYHWARDAGRKRWRHREACDWHFILDKCIRA